MLVSIGYKSLPVAGQPFDARSGTVPNVQGRVLAAASGEVGGQKGGGAPSGNSGSTASVASPNNAASCFEPGLYVCGWLKRGPTGIIGTNLVSSRHLNSGSLDSEPEEDG